MLLGADVYSTIVEEGLRKGDAAAPIAQRTTLGWILYGAIGGNGQRRVPSSLQCCAHEDLVDVVRCFWEQEEPSTAPAPLSDSERQCEEHFVRTYARLPCGRYVVRLPVATTLPSLEGSRRRALRALHSMERRLASDAALRASYSEFMDEYERLGHMSPAPSLDQRDRGRVCYLPHHGVVKSVGESSKLRVVFNGSARLDAGGSLNDCLITGPNLLPPLADVLARWPHHRFVLATDIEKMYR